MSAIANAVPSPEMEMVIADKDLFNDLCQQTISQFLEETPNPTVMRAKVLHVSNLIEDPNAEVCERFGYMSTSLEVPIPQSIPTGAGTYFDRMAVLLHRELLILLREKTTLHLQ